MLKFKLCAHASTQSFYIIDDMMSWLTYDDAMIDSWNYLHDIEAWSPAKIRSLILIWSQWSQGLLLVQPAGFNLTLSTAPASSLWHPPLMPPHQYLIVEVHISSDAVVSLLGIV